MERYERIKAISGELMQENCPVIFEKGALLKDNKSGKNILQLQFESICNDLIEAVYLSVDCFDVENRLVETSEKVYLDLTLKYGDVFGSNQAIELNSDLSRNYEFTINKIIFADNRIIEYSGKMGAIEQPEKLAELVELKEQYIREVSKIHRTLTCKVKPTDYNGFWWCTCGALNYGENCKCGICGIDKEKLFSLLDTDFLIEQHSEFLKQKEIEELQKKQQEEKRLEEIKKQEEIRQIKRKKNKKIALVVVGIVFALCIIYGLVVTFGVPAMKYSSALKAINNSNYEEGFSILRTLSTNDEEYFAIIEDFINNSEVRDTPEIRRECINEYVHILTCNEEYDKAIRFLKLYDDEFALEYIYSYVIETKNQSEIYQEAEEYFMKGTSLAIRKGFELLDKIPKDFKNTETIYKTYNNLKDTRFKETFVNGEYSDEKLIKFTMYYSKEEGFDLLISKRRAFGNNVNRTYVEEGEFIIQDYEVKGSDSLSYEDGENVYSWTLDKSGNLTEKCNGQQYIYRRTMSKEMARQMFGEE